MNWDAIGAIGELIGALAVLITLIYLAAQIKQNTASVRSSNAATVQINVQQLAKEVISDRVFGEILIRALAGTEKLDPEEKIAAYAWFFTLLKNGELAYAHYVNGDLDEEYWHGFLNFFRAYWLTPGFKEYWNDRKAAFIPKFQLSVGTWMADAATQVTRADKMYPDRS